MSRLKSRCRRRGEWWTLYSVHQNAGPIGFIVFDGAETRNPVAFVPGVKPNALRLAVKINANSRLAARAVDLRKLPFEKLPRELIGGIHYLADKRGQLTGERRIQGSILFPVNVCGRRITSDRAPLGVMLLVNFSQEYPCGMMEFIGEIPPRMEQKKNSDLKLLESPTSVSKGKTRKVANHC